MRDGTSCSMRAHSCANANERRSARAASCVGAQQEDDPSLQPQGTSGGAISTHDVSWLINCNFLASCSLLAARSTSSVALDSASCRRKEASLRGRAVVLSS